MPISLSQMLGLDRTPPAPPVVGEPGVLDDRVADELTRELAPMTAELANVTRKLSAAETALSKAKPGNVAACIRERDAMAARKAELERQLCAREAQLKEPRASDIAAARQSAIDQDQAETRELIADVERCRVQVTRIGDELTAAGLALDAANKRLDAHVRHADDMRAGGIMVPMVQRPKPTFEQLNDILPDWKPTPVLWQKLL